ncbi:MAG: phospholipase D-like domain-containing protein [Candidatus Altiarchaeota archaeon]
MRDRLAGGIILVFVGMLAGMMVADYGYGNVCPSRICVDSADVVPISDRGYFMQLHNALSNAGESIHIVSFELKYYEGYPNSSMNVIIQDLIDAKNRGVDVRIVVDEFSEADNAHHILAANGIEVRNDSKSTTTHAKLVVIDGEIVVLGSTNLSYYGLERNNEVDVLIRDREAAGYFEGYFQGLWDAS